MLDKDEQIGCLVYLKGLIEAYIAHHEAGEAAEDRVLNGLDAVWDAMGARCRGQINKMDICTFFQDLTMYGDEE